MGGKLHPAEAQSLLILNNNDKAKIFNRGGVRCYELMEINANNTMFDFTFYKKGGK
jgi:hypothetical protein